MTAPSYRFRVGDEVTVNYPPSRRHPRGRRLEGTVEARRLTQPLAKERYTVLFADGTAEPLIPGFWIEPHHQEALEV